MADTCTHLDTVEDVTPSSDGCEDCRRIGGRWVHLRLRKTCGHVGCCDNSPNRHATAHWHARPDHPLIRSYEPGEDWWWCYADDLFFEVDAPPSPCIASHARGAARRGATMEEVAEALGVAILMNGGPVTVHAPRAFESFQEFAKT